MSDDRDARDQRPSNARFGPAYQGTLEAVFAVVIAMGIGAGADSYFDSSPVGLLVGLGIGFASFVLRLTRLMRELNPEAQSGSDDEASGNGNGSTNGDQGPRP